MAFSNCLHGQTALVTGASSGIGAAAAIALAQAGAKVGINYRSGALAAEAIVKRICDAGGSAIAIEADVTREADVQSMMSRFVAATGRLDILVANAGVQVDAPTIDMTVEQWRHVLDVNLTGQFLCAREAVKQFSHRRIQPCPWRWEKSSV